MKKGQPKRFRKGNMVKASSTNFPTPPGDYISTWNTHPIYDQGIEAAAWVPYTMPVGQVKSKSIYTVIDTHNFPHPSKEQYCLILGPAGEEGWVSSRFLEKIQ